MTIEMKIMQQHKYNVRKSDVNDIFDLSFDDMYLCAVTENNYIRVWKNNIYDSSHSQVMNLNNANLNWCCGYESFTNVKEAYRLKPSTKLFNQLQK